MIAFAAKSFQAVYGFHSIGITGGAADYGAPGLRREGKEVAHAAPLHVTPSAIGICAFCIDSNR